MVWLVTDSTSKEIQLVTSDFVFNSHHVDIDLEWICWHCQVSVKSHTTSYCPYVWLCKCTYQCAIWFFSWSQNPKCCYIQATISKATDKAETCTSSLNIVSGRLLCSRPFVTFWKWRWDEGQSRHSLRSYRICSHTRNLCCRISLRKSGIRNNKDIFRYRPN